MVEARSASTLGPRLRELRTTRGLSLERLASRSGVSRAMLSKVERGENTPTITVLLKVASALEVSAAELIGVEPRARAIKVPASSRISFVDPETGFERQLFPAFEDAPVEFLRHVIPPGASSGDLPAHVPGPEKYVLMEKGRLRVVVDTEEHLLAPGDLFHFRGDVPHRFDNAGRGKCSYYLIKTSTTR